MGQPLQEGMDLYLEHIRVERNLSGNTSSAYASDLMKFLRHLEKDGVTACDGVNAAHISGFMASLGRAGMAVKSQARCLSAVRMLFKFLVKERHLTINPATDVDRPRMIKKLPQFLDAGEVNELLAAPQTAQPRGFRDLAMLETMYATGLRVSEVAGLLTTDCLLYTSPSPRD
mgnify:CR=1 FL=1